MTTISAQGNGRLKLAPLKTFFGPRAKIGNIIKKRQFNREKLAKKNYSILFRQWSLTGLAVGAGFLIAFFAPSANAQIFQFTPEHKNYTAALSIAAAQEAAEEINVEEKITLDEDLAPEDFGLRSVGILPTNPFYFLKNARRGIADFFTFDDIAKVERRLNYAAEKLLEVKTLAEREGTDTADIQDALDNFQAELAVVRARVAEIQTVDTEESWELAKKLMDAVLKYEKILGKLEHDLPPEIFDHIENVKDETSGTFDAVFKLTDPENIREDIGAVLDEQKGSEFKHFKNIEILKNIEESVPEDRRDTIRLAQDDALAKLQGELEQLDDAKRSLFGDFVKEIGGNEVRHIEILNELEVLPLSDEARSALSRAKEESLTRTETRLTALTPEQKEKFLKSLEEGRFEDVRLLNDLEDNIGEGVLGGLAVKKKVEDNFVRRVEAEDDEEFTDSIKRFHDAKSISVLDEIESLIPPDKKDFFATLKQKAAEEIQHDLNRARDAAQRDAVLGALAGDRPEYFETIHRLEQDVGDLFRIESILEGVRAAQYERIREKVQAIKNQDRLLRYEEEFKKQDTHFSEFEKLFRDRREMFESPDKILQKMKHAELAIEELTRLIDTLPLDEGFSAEKGFDSVIDKIEQLRALALRRLDSARAFMELGDHGRALGEAEDSERAAREAIGFAAEYKSGKKIFRCPFVPPISDDFCSYGTIVYEVDENGCELPPRCEGKRDGQEPRVSADGMCGGISGYVCPDGFFCKMPRLEPDEFLATDPVGECVEQDFRCDASFEGYVFDTFSRSCYFESTSACSDPYTYHTKEGCEKAHGIGSATRCPALPTVESCPAGQKREVSFSSPECGTFYECRSETPAGSCGNYICESGETFSSCPSDCTGAGPDPLGCENRTTQSDCASDSACDWFVPRGVSGVDGTCYLKSDAGSCNYNGICDANEYYRSCPGDCGGTATGAMQNCFYPNATINGAPAGFTVWCEGDYVNCHEGDPSGASVSLNGLSLGAPSSCESGWSNTNTCNNNNYCDTWETADTCGDCTAPTYGDCRENASSDSCRAQPGCAWYANSFCEGDDYPTRPSVTYPYRFPGSGTKCETYDMCFGYCKTVKTYAYNTSDPQMCDKYWPGASTQATYCGDNYCDQSEKTQGTCPLDCGDTATTPPPSSPPASTPPTTTPPSATACNDNGICEYGESSGSCPADCGSTAGSVCPSGSYNATLSGITMTGVCVKDGVTCPDTSAWASSCPNGPFHWDSNGCPTSCQTYNNTAYGDCSNNVSESSCYAQPGCAWYGSFCGGDNYTGGGIATGAMQNCFYPNATINGAPAGFTVWCEGDYVNCHEGDPSGASVSLNGLSLGAPSSCESGWNGGGSGGGFGTDVVSGCNNDGICDSNEYPAICPSDCGQETGGGYGGSCYGAYTDEPSCLSAGCVWYQDHYDGTHCDDSAHGTTNGGAGVFWFLRRFFH